MGEENRGFVFCLDNLEDVLKHEEYIEKLGYKLIRIKHFEDVINAQSNAIMKGEIEVPVIFFINSSVFLKAWDNDQVRLRHLKRKYIGCVLVFKDDVKVADRMHEVLIDELEVPAAPGRIKRLLRNAEKRMLLEIEKAKLRREIGLRVLQMKEMQQIGISLSIERDIRKLLGNILEKARELTNSDAGSIYLIDRNSPKKLRFVKAQNESVDVPFEETEMELNKSSIAGCCVVSGKLININDAYHISKKAPFTHNQDWDDSIGYRTKSILCVPMSINSGETIGCIQLINRKSSKEVVLEDPITDIDKHVISFNIENKSMISSFASQAAVAISNSYLLEDIENLIEGLVRASVVAIESRDPATSGHSSRVADLSITLAQAVTTDKDGIYKDVSFTKENLRVLKYASLLHDFGKVGIREEILKKKNKLYKHEQDNIAWKIELYKRMKEIAIMRQTIDKLASVDDQHDEDMMADIEMKIMKSKIEYDKLLDRINEASLPLPKNDSIMQDILKHKGDIVTLSNGTQMPLVTEDEFDRLSINYGSLTDSERKDIESHVTHTINFLNEIPWTKDLQEIICIAGSHHERNDGAGYPEGLIMPEIPLESKIMAVADVFDSLTAWDRPYKEAMSVDEAIDILREDAEQNKLDSELVRLFITNKVYEKHVENADISDPAEKETAFVDLMTKSTETEIDAIEIETKSDFDDFGEKQVIFPEHPMSDAIDSSNTHTYTKSDNEVTEASDEITDESIDIVVEKPDEVDGIMKSADLSEEADETQNEFNINYDDYEETQTSLSKDFIELELKRMKRSNNKHSSDDTSSSDEEETIIADEDSTSGIEDNDDVIQAESKTPEIQTQDEDEKQYAEKLAILVSEFENEDYEDTADEQEIDENSEGDKKHKITDETSIHVDLGSLTELENFVEEIENELKMEFSHEITDIDSKDEASEAIETDDESEE